MTENNKEKAEETAPKNTTNPEAEPQKEPDKTNINDSDHEKITKDSIITEDLSDIDTQKIPPRKTGKEPLKVVPKAKSVKRQKHKSGSKSNHMEQSVLNPRFTPGKIVLGSIIFLVGLILLFAGWSTFTFIFEPSQPQIIDVNTFETSKFDLDVFMDQSRNMSASRYVTLDKGEIYNYEFVPMPVDPSKRPEFIYAYVGQKQKKFHEDVAWEMMALLNKKKTIEKVRTQDYPKISKARFLVITTDSKPQNNRNETNFLTKRKVTGIARPFFDLSQKYKEELTDRQTFNGITDKTNLYVVFEGERPPDFFISLSLFLLPIILIFIGGFILLKQPKANYHQQKINKRQPSRTPKTHTRRR